MRSTFSQEANAIIDCASIPKTTKGSTINLPRFIHHQGMFHKPLPNDLKGAKPALLPPRPQYL